MFVRDLLFEYVIPDFKKQKRKAHLFNVEGESDEMQRLDQMLVGIMMEKAVDTYEKVNGRLPSLLEFELEKQRVLLRLTNRPSRTMEIPEAFYEDIKYKIDIVITGEQIDLPSEIETLTNLYGTPTVQQNPELANKILEKILNLAGQNPVGVLPRQMAAPGAAGMPTPGFKNSQVMNPPTLNQMGV